MTLRIVADLCFLIDLVTILRLLQKIKYQTNCIRPGMDANEVLKRRNLRGLVKCKACNFYNGIRATACKNKKCMLSKVEVKRKIKPKINAIELVSNGESKLFSVQVRDRDVDNRNFVSVTDKIVSSDASASIISRNAICYVDTCKYDSNDVNISCKHVKSSLESCTSKAKIQNLDEDILMRLQINDEKRTNILNMLKESKLTTSPVQRINQRVFVVRCDASLSFPIGLLHVTCSVESNDVRFCCACRKAKNMISINQRSLVGKDVCEHILMILAAILSDLSLHKEFETLVAILKPLLADTSSDCQWINDEITSVPIATAYNDLSGTTIAATLVESLDNIELIQIPLTEGTGNLDGSFFSLEQCNDESIQHVDMKNLPIAVESITADDQINSGQYSDGLELVNYKVELMDQFEFRNESVNEASNQNTLSIDGGYGVDEQSRSTDVVLSYLYPEDFSIDDLPMEVMETLQKPTSNNECTTQSDDDGGGTEHERICRSLDDSQLDAYINWLSSVIEATNFVLDFNQNGYPEPLIFSVPHTYFDIFRTKFSAGTKKKRLPNQTTIITDGKYKNLTMFTWIFSNIKLVKYILSTTIIELEVVRSFRKTSQNTYEYISPHDMNKLNEDDVLENHNRKIRPTIYKTFLKVKSLDNSSKFQNKTAKHGLFKIEWIPNTLPISKYGEMRIKLQFGHMKNDQIC